MAARTHLLDLMELPPLQRRMIQLLLRQGTILESELRRLVRVLPDGDRLTPAEFDTILESLERAGWLIRNTDGDELCCRVQFSQKTPKSDDAFWERLSLESIRQQWRVRLPVVDEIAPTRAESQSNASDDETAKEDLLMRRGGKRTLSKAIWDKLDAEPSTTPGAEPKSRTAGLRDALDKPKDKPTSDKKDIRKKLWDAFGDDGE